MNVVNTKRMYRSIVLENRTTKKKDRTVEGATVSGGKGEEWERGGQKNELSASRKLCGEGGDFNARLRDPENNGGE